MKERERKQEVVGEYKLTSKSERATGKKWERRMEAMNDKNITTVICDRGRENPNVVMEGGLGREGGTLKKMRG